MDPETALELVKHGGTLLLLDVPPYTLIGIDTQIFSSGPNFKGIKMIPPGIHFVYYSSSNREGSDFSPIVGFFSSLGSSEVIVRKWDQKEERLVKLLDEEDERYFDAVKRLEFDKQLGPYDLSQYGDWKRLSNYITKDTVERIGCLRKMKHYHFLKFDGEALELFLISNAADFKPIGGEITIANESDMAGKVFKTAMEEALAEQLKNSKLLAPEDKSQRKSCYYTAIPRVVKAKGMSSEELTNLNLDKVLESILMKEYKGCEDALLAELQFAFIAFLMGQSLEAFLQWKLLVRLLFDCVEAPLHTRSQLFMKFLGVLHNQLKYGFQKEHNNTGAADKGVSVLLDESLLSSDSFLHHLCKDFFSLILEAPVVDGDLLSRTRKLKELLEDSLGWQFEQNSMVDGISFHEDDEYAPVVEMLDDPDYMNT